MALASDGSAAMARANGARGLPRFFPRRPNAGRPRAQRAVSVAVQVAVVCAGAAALLLRVGGIPAWDVTYAEDNGVFLVDGLVRPWHLLVPYSGYLELGPRFIGQLIASLVPIVDASAAYAVTGALIGAATGLFLYYASEGYIRAPWARALLGGALVLLPIAPLEIIDSGVNSPWYALAALFFAVLWRPRSWPGMLAAALVACYASSSEIIALTYLPLLLIRLIALPRVREHAVTAGWLLGLVLQVPVVVLSYAQHKQRLGALSTPGQAIAFYCHNVVLRALGWHLSVWLQSLAGYNGATVIVGAVLALALGWVLVTGDGRVRLFAAVALLAGFAQTAFEATVAQDMIFQPPTSSFMAAARYSTVPVLLIAATGIVAVDSYVRRTSVPAAGGRAALPASGDARATGRRGHRAAGAADAVRALGRHRGRGAVLRCRVLSRASAAPRAGTVSGADAVSVGRCHWYAALCLRDGRLVSLARQCCAVRGECDLAPLDARPLVSRLCPGRRARLRLGHRLPVRQPALARAATGCPTRRAW